MEGICDISEQAISRLKLLFSLGKQMSHEDCEVVLSVQSSPLYGEFFNFREPTLPSEQLREY